MNLELGRSKIMLTQFDPHGSDPKLHGHGDEFQISIPLIGVPLLEHGDAPKVAKLPDYGRFITAPGELHRHFAGEGASRLLLINFKQRFLEDVLQDRLHHLPTSLEFAPWSEGPNDAFRKLAERLMKVSMAGPFDVETQEVELELAQVLLSAQPGTHTAYWNANPEAQHHPAIGRVLALIHDTHASTDLSLDGLAEEAGLSKYHLLRLFRTVIGRTPGQYLAEVRLERAEGLLAETELDVTTVCFDVGYGSLSSMERAFKQKYGMSPTEYRRQKRGS
nr:AraC family transcriptional regulator [Tumebacillus amylolyticus]